MLYGRSADVVNDDPTGLIQKYKLRSTLDRLTRYFLSKSGRTFDAKRTLTPYEPALIRAIIDEPARSCIRSNRCSPRSGDTDA